MKIATIALLLICIQVAASMVGIAGGFTYTISNELDAQLSNDLIDTTKGDYTQSTLEKETTTFGYGDFSKVLGRFKTIMAFTPFGVIFVFEGFGVHSSIATPFSILIYTIYGLALAQFVANRSFKGMR